MENNTDKILDSKNKGINYIKNRAFDLIAVGIIIAVTALSLGVTELREISINTLVDIVLECLPFYIAAVMLSNNYYNKGVYVGKETEAFKNSIDYYSEMVGKLDGKMMNFLPQFCNEYNENALKDKQTILLRSKAITYELYNEGNGDIKALKSMTKKELNKMFNDETVKVIQKCKKLKVKGVYANLLLGNLHSSDNTDLGYSEKDLRRKRSASYAGTYVITIFLMSLIGVKNMMQWGWMGAALTLFKILYIALGAYTKYFNGYEDVTVNITNHMYRKTDILKEFNFWYDKLKKDNSETVIK